MAYRWPDDTVFTRLALHGEEQWCQTCGCRLRVCDHRHRRVFTLHGPLHVVCKLVHCPERGCQPFPAKAYAIENKRLTPSGFRKHKINRINDIRILCR